MKDTPTPPSTCECGYRFDRAASAFGDSAPKPGDITLCIKCGNVMLFQEDMTARRATPGELTALDDDTLEEIARAQRAIRDLQAKRN